MDEFEARTEVFVQAVTRKEATAFARAIWGRKVRVTLVPGENWSRVKVWRTEAGKNE